MRNEHVRTLRATHRTVTTLLPLFTAGLAVTGALLASMEKDARKASEQGTGNGKAGASAHANVTPGGYLRTLVARVVGVIVGLAVVALLASIFLAGDTTQRAVEITVLVVLVLYLAEKVTRQTRRTA